MWQSKGYKNQKLFLDSALQSKKYSHAYLFCGPDRENKKELAIEFAQKIMAVADKSRINPDLIVLDREKFKIEDIRGLISELSLKPFQYEYKVAIVEDFENVTDEAANSILKTLEEPNPSTIIILLARNQLSVLSTIASRCQAIYFSQLEAKNNSDKFLSGLAGKTKAQKLAAIKEFAEKETSELTELIESWVDAERQQFLAGKPQKYVNLQNLIESLQGLKQNLNKKLILEKLFLNLA